MDPESGLYYYRNRYYHQSLGTFVTRDPALYNAGLNLYEYAEDSPEQLRDPFGLLTCEKCCENLAFWKKICYGGEALCMCTYGATLAGIGGCIAAAELCLAGILKNFADCLDDCTGPTPSCLLPEPSPPCDPTYGERHHCPGTPF
jgi:hypothetical protein